MGPGANIDEGAEVFLFSQRGQPLGQVKAETEFRRQGSEASSPPPKPGEIILEAIDRLDVTEPVYYIVWVEYGYRIIDHHSDPEWKVTIYKPAKDLRIADLVAKAENKSEAKIAAQVNF